MKHLLILNKKGWVLFLWLVGNIIGISNLVMAQQLFKISFDDGFDGDTVTLTLNGELVFENEIITSDLITGSSLHKFIFKEDKLGGYALDKHYLTKTLTPKIPKKRNLRIWLLINGRKFKKRIDLKKGHFISIDLWHFDNDILKVKFYQQDKPFDYY